jgi:hypothetical protein
MPEHSIRNRFASWRRTFILSMQTHPAYCGERGECGKRQRQRLGKRMLDLKLSEGENEKTQGIPEKPVQRLSQGQGIVVEPVDAARAWVCRGMQGHCRHCEAYALCSTRSCFKRN